MVTIRAATVADVAAIARVDVDTWRNTYAGILPTDLLVGLTTRQRSAAWGRFIARRPGDVLVAVDETDEILAFGSCGPQRDHDWPFAGEIYTLYVRTDWQGQGLGRDLLVAMFGRLIQLGGTSCLIWVVRENPARFFYERLGGKIAAIKPVKMGRSTLVDTIGYGWTDLRDAIASRATTKSRISDGSASF